MNILTAKHLNKTYSGQFSPAIKNISLTVKKGQILGLVGESGSGKTTLLRIIAGLEDADSGSVLLQNKYVTGPAHNLVPGHPYVRLVHQDFNLAPNISVRKNILYSLKGYDPDYIEERLKKMIHLCDLTYLQDKLPRQLSGGEMQRVALARALSDEPLLLLLDEPFSNMDILRRQEIKHEISDIIRRSETTAIFVTHDTTEALAFSDKVAVMQNGTIVQQGKPYDVYNHPVTPYVAAFFGYANIIHIQQLLPFLKQPDASIVSHSHKLACIRAEHIHTCTEDEAELTGNIKRVDYLGIYELWEIELSQDVSLQLIQFQKVTPSEKVYLKVMWQQVHVFSR